jgi:regulator of protease activity HflC (stomatin/prohibitin superfamily)
VIHAEGELQASEKLAQAAEILARQPQAIQLRYLETLTVIAADKNSTIVFPLPDGPARTPARGRQARHAGGALTRRHAAARNRPPRRRV